jgi:hypothetical protein
MSSVTEDKIIRKLCSEPCCNIKTRRVCGSCNKINVCKTHETCATCKGIEFPVNDSTPALSSDEQEKM